MPNSVYSVTQINKYIKNMFRSDHLLENLTIKGEISNLKYHSSGHIYFTLKDSGSAIKCVMFQTYARALKFRMAEGMEIEAKGSIEVFERDGTYQLYAQSAKQGGKGNLFEEFERLKKMMEAEGMFDSRYKRPIPKNVKTLGVVTAPTGAAVRDIIDVSKRRNPGIQIVLYPAIVQGDEAPTSIVKGIMELNEYGVDAIIVGRGGGSIEDLWGFNDEAVCQAIFNSEVPIVSAVGHETDFTLADFVSDLRAPTPSAAAELCVADVRSVLRDINARKELLNRDMRAKIIDSHNNILRLSEKMAALNPKVKIEKKKQELIRYENLLKGQMDKILLRKHSELRICAERLNGRSPLLKLSSGYSYVSDADGKAVKSIKNVKADDVLTINVTDGKVTTKVLSTEGQGENG